VELALPKLRSVYAADVVEYRLQKAKECGADVLINSANEDLKTRLFKETNGDGAGRVVECSGAPAMVNSCFGMTRKVSIYALFRLSIGFFFTLSGINF